MVMVNDLSDMLLDLVCHYFIFVQIFIRRLACSSPCRMCLCSVLGGV
jgi:hypothetical protein